jgi:hypothetical protein
LDYIPAMTDAPKYAPSAAKAVEVIVWIASERPGIDIYHVVKTAFFADKSHISQWGRPIVGDTYAAAPYGPLPQVIYGLLKRDPIEMLAFGGNGDLPFLVDGYRVRAARAPNTRLLSKSDLSALRFGLEHTDGKSFDDLYVETHDDPAYIRAQSGIMDYRDFISDADPQKARKVAYLSEVAPVAVF